MIEGGVIGGGATSPGVAALVLLVVLLVGVSAGRSKKRFVLLLGGLVALAVAGFVLTAVAGQPAPNPAAGTTAFYAVALPLVVTYLAGWVCGRARWFTRLVVIALAALLLAAFPYDAAGRATADRLDPGAAPASSD